MQVQAGARADLAKAQGQACFGRDGQETAKEDRRAGDLVGLRRPLEKGQDET